MTSKECGQAIAKKLREVWDIYQEYYPGGDGLHVVVTDQAAYVWNNQSFDGGEKALDYYVPVIKEVGEDAID